jgi:hypothetical protein
MVKSLSSVIEVYEQMATSAVQILASLLIILTGSIIIAGALAKKFCKA